ncbi:hypothetical protein [uncultured Parasutterella sp.]|uniref:hypothetical protein n=1 Tax=uncultured Parasutterella sp. TaxID=1263098 RepID=UPI002599EC40|nr:hypothetical protein [uncultured Parasutterella sp.]
MEDYNFQTDESVLVKRIQQLAKKLDRGELEKIHAFAKDTMPWVKDLHFRRDEFEKPKGIFKGMDVEIIVTKDTQPAPKKLTDEERDLLSKVQDFEISAVLKMLSHLSTEQLQAICQGKEIKNSIIGTFDLKLILACISCLAKM